MVLDISQHTIIIVISIILFIALFLFVYWDNIQTLFEGGNIKRQYLIDLNDNFSKAKNIEKMEKLIEACVEPKTREEMMAFPGPMNRDHFRKAYLKPPLDSGRLKMTIPDKPKSKNQKYIRSDG